MADESEGIDIKLSEEDSPADILRESEDISLFADDHGTGDASAAAADSILDDDFPDSEDGDLKLRMDEIGDLVAEIKSEEDDIKHRVDEIGDLVDEIKLDDQEEEKADASADGEEDMVFEETEGQVGDSVENALDELGEEESTENSTEDASAGEDGSEESQEDTAAAESEKDNEEEIVAESDDSENIEVSEEPESTPEAEADTEISEESESEASESGEQTEEETDSSDVMDMLHDPEVAEESDESESAESEDLDLGVEELDDTVEEETSEFELEEAESDAPAAEDSEIDDLENLTESEDEVTAQSGIGSLLRADGDNTSISEETSDEPEEMSEQTSADESGVQDEPEIENVGSVMPQEQDSSEETIDSLGSKMLLSLHHDAVVEIARTTLTGEEITQITYGSIIELDKAAGEPVDLVLDGKTIARGEIVQINNDKLGIRIVGIVQD